MVFSQFATPLSCHEVQLLTSGYLEHDPSLSADQFAAIEEHLQGCAACREVYDTDQALIRLMHAHWPAIYEKLSPLVELPIGADEAEEAGMSTEEGWQNLLRACPDLANAYHRQMQRKRLRQMGFRVGKMTAVVTGITLVFGVGWSLLPFG